MILTGISRSDAICIASTLLQFEGYCLLKHYEACDFTPVKYYILLHSPR